MVIQFNATSAAQKANTSFLSEPKFSLIENSPIQDWLDKAHQDHLTSRIDNLLSLCDTFIKSSVLSNGISIVPSTVVDGQVHLQKAKFNLEESTKASTQDEAYELLNSVIENLHAAALDFKKAAKDVDRIDKMDDSGTPHNLYNKLIPILSNLAWGDGQQKPGAILLAQYLCKAMYADAAKNNPQQCGIMSITSIDQLK